MYSLSSEINFKTYFINFLFVIIPISFIAGNLIINLNIILFIISSIVLFDKNIFKIKIYILDKIVLISFFYILVNGLFNQFYSIDANPQDYTILIKTLLFTRYLFFYFIIRCLVDKKIINFKYFFLSCSFCSVFVCLDLIYQLNFGKDIFGYEVMNARRLSGPFGNEGIAGSYLQRFSIFTFFLIPLFFKFNNKKFFYLIFLFLFLLIGFSIIISGNRMPLVLYGFTIIMMLIFEEKTRKFIFHFLVLSLFIIFFSYNFNTNVKRNFNDFGLKINEIVTFFSNLNPNKREINIDNLEHVNDSILYYVKVGDKEIPITNVYIKEFNAGYQTWLYKKYFGGGIKSFKTNCAKTQTRNCGPHPHNYYLEILAELGLVGFLCFFSIFTIIIYQSLIKKYFMKNELNSNFLITPFIFIFLAEIFPIKSTGSFFTTNNATFIFLLLAVIAALSKDKNFN